MGPTLAPGDGCLVLEQTSDSIRLRLRSRAGGPTRVAFGLLAVILVAGGVLLALAFLVGERPSYPAAAVVLGMPVAFLAALYLVGRWSLRQGVLVSLTPDRFAIRKHWSEGGAALELPPDRVRFEETARELVVRKGRKAVRFGSGLTADGRRSVVAFLNAEIARHRDSEGATGPVPSAEELDVLALALSGQFRRCGEEKVHLAPAIPPAVLVAALQGYLDLQEDEVLLAILGVGKDGASGSGCALTTRRLYWPGKAAPAVGDRPARCRSREYAGLPEAIGRSGFGAATLDLGDGCRFGLGGDRELADAVERHLDGMRALARGARPEGAVPDLPWARAAWPRVAASGAESRAIQAQVRAFHARVVAVSGVKVTPVLIAACVAVYAAMVARGVSPLDPTPQSVFAWGADFGPAIVFDRQYWRTITSLFLHFGLIHLAMNMYCLYAAGPAIERFFGHFGFAALYLLSGLGGAVASLWYHPMVISAGASGAIFGIFGGLLGYLAIRHREVPAAVLQPMRAGALAFVGYNTVFSLSMPGIDMAAHLGGLASGFACGLLLTAVAPARPGAGWLGRLARRAGAVVVCGAVLAGLGALGLEGARARILADPAMGPAILGQIDAAPAWNAFYEQANPAFAEFDRIGAGIDRFLGDLKHESPVATLNATLDRLRADGEALGARIAGLPAGNPEIGAIRGHLADAQRYQLQMVAALRRLVATGDDSHVVGPDGFNASLAAYKKEFETFKTLRDAYFRAHHLEAKPPAP